MTAIMYRQPKQAQGIFFFFFEGRYLKILAPISQQPFIPRFISDGTVEITRIWQLDTVAYGDNSNLILHIFLLL